MRLWTPVVVLPVGLLLMAGLLYAAVGADCVRIREELVAAVDETGAELYKLERRFSEMTGTPPAPAYMYWDHGPFREVIARFRRETSAAASPPANRDEIAGILSRWEAVAAEHESRRNALFAYVQSLRGRIADRVRLDGRFC